MVAVECLGKAEVFLPTCISCLYADFTYFENGKSYAYKQCYETAKCEYIVYLPYVFLCDLKGPLLNEKSALLPTYVVVTRTHNRNTLHSLRQNVYIMFSGI